MSSPFDWMNNPTLLLAFVTSLATVAVAAATIYYAYINKKLWQHTRKEPLKKIKLDEICFIIKPFIETFERNIEQIGRDSILWDVPSKSIYLDKIKHHSSVEIPYSIFIAENPSFEKEIEDYNNDLDELVTDYKLLVAEIISNGFNEKIEETKKEYVEKNQLDIKDLANVVMHHVLSGTNWGDIQQLSEGFREYWDRYCHVFLKMKETEEAKEAEKKVKELIKEIHGSSLMIKYKLSKIIHFYVIEYGISLEEIEAKDMPSDERRKSAML